eukprot:scaffold2532_cov243-Pinguiococcus_pyrenoidosus.AAC.2
MTVPAAKSAFSAPGTRFWRTRRRSPGSNALGVIRNVVGFIQLHWSPGSMRGALSTSAQGNTSRKAETSTLPENSATTSKSESWNLALSISKATGVGSREMLGTAAGGVGPAASVGGTRAELGGKENEALGVSVAVVASCSCRTRETDTVAVSVSSGCCSSNSGESRVELTQ